VRFRSGLIEVRRPTVIGFFPRPISNGLMAKPGLPQSWMGWILHARADSAATKSDSLNSGHAAQSELGDSSASVEPLNGYLRGHVRADSSFGQRSD
jgi:hypothetical protein